MIFFKYTKPDEKKSYMVISKFANWWIAVMGANNYMAPLKNKMTLLFVEKSATSNNTGCVNDDAYKEV